MTALTLDGKAASAAVKADLTERCARLAEQGIVPGLATILVGDDPGSHSYVGGKHKASTAVGVKSFPCSPDAPPMKVLPRPVMQKVAPSIAREVRGIVKSTLAWCTGPAGTVPAGASARGSETSSGRTPGGSSTRAGAGAR